MAVITRDDWRAGPHRAETIPLPVQRLYLHHSVTPQWLGAEAARNLQNIARARGFLDISYSWLVDVAGNQIEGRGWGRAGAHTVGWNSTSHAICLVGNFQDDVPPPAMLAAAAALARKHARVGPGRITHGHRDVSSTACPGQHAYSRIGDINKLALQEDDMPLTDAEKNELVERISAAASAQTLERLANKDGDLAIKARQQIAAEVWFRVRKDLNLQGEPAESVNAWLQSARAAQHAHEAHEHAADAHHVGMDILALLHARLPAPAEPTPEPM